MATNKYPFQTSTDILPPLLNEETAVSITDYLTGPYKTKLDKYTTKRDNMLSALTPEQQALITTPPSQLTKEQKLQLALNGLTETSNNYRKNEGNIAKVEGDIEALTNVRGYMEDALNQGRADIQSSSDAVMRGNALAAQNSIAGLQGMAGNRGAGIGTLSQVAAQANNQLATQNAQANADRLKALAANDEARTGIITTEINKLTAEEQARLNKANAKQAKMATTMAVENQPLEQAKLQAEINAANRSGASTQAAHPDGP